MFTRFEILLESDSTLASARIWKSVLDSTICVVSNPPSSMALGRWLLFNVWRAVERLVGSSINSKDRGEREPVGFRIMPSRLRFPKRATRRREGSSRESKKDYLHFLYIARGSLSETQYFIHLARRLGYLSPEEADSLHTQTKLTFACLHGLIQAVEKEAGKLSKVVATVTSLLVIGLARWSSSQLSVVP
jgi:hypothetical protein